MSHAAVGPGAPTVGPGGGLVGPTTLTVEVPAGVLTLTGPPPGIGTIHVDVPAGIVTLSAVGPATAFVIPAGVVTISGPAPRPAVAIPAGVVTLSGPVPAVRQGTAVQVPAGLILVQGQARVSTSTSTSPIRVYLGGIEISSRVMWGATTEEVLGGPGSAQLEVHDPDLTGFDPEPHEEVYIDVRATAWPLFHGETITPAFDIEPAREYPVWTIPCRDYNSQLGERLVGAPDGNQYWRPDVNTPFEAVDPSAISGATDKTTVQQWMRDYFRLPSGILPDTGTYVGEYVPNSYLGAVEHIMWLYTATTTLQSALESLAAAGEDTNIQFWLMPDDRFAWLAIPRWQDLNTGASQGLLPSAPVDLGTGGTAVRLGLKGTKDGGAMAQALYVQGATGFTFDQDTGTIVSGGSGWYPSVPAPTQRQAYLGVPAAWTETSKNRIASAAYRRASDPTLRMTMTVIEENMGGFRAGQVVNVTKDILPDSVTDGAGTGRYVIQRVGTSLLAGTNHFSTVLDVGDGPVSRMGGVGRNTQALAAQEAETATRAKPIVKDLFVDFTDISPTKHGDRRDFTVSPQNEVATFWVLTGATITFEVHVYDADTELEVFTSDATTDPTSAAADRDGRARAVLVCDSTRDDLKYEVHAWITLVPA